jgi:hypothetical protein
MSDTYDLTKILKELTIPSHLDVTDRAYLVHVYEKSSRAAIGTGIVDRNEIVLFNRGSGQINQMGNTLGWLDRLKERIVIDISNPYIMPFTASIRILRADGTEFIPDPKAPTAWTVEYETPAGARYINNIPHGVAIDQTIFSSPWPISRVKLTARCLGQYGVLEFDKVPAGNLGNLIVVRQLSGLNYPEAA